MGENCQNKSIMLNIVNESSVKKKEKISKKTLLKGVMIFKDLSLFDWSPSFGCFNCLLVYLIYWCMRLMMYDYFLLIFLLLFYAISRSLFQLSNLINASNKQTRVVLSEGRTLGFTMILPLFSLHTLNIKENIYRMS